MRDRSGQAPWRSYSGLASPAPRTCPPWRFVSMLRCGPVPLPLPASAEMASQCPGRAQDCFHGSLGLAQLDLRCRKLKRHGRKGGTKGGRRGKEGGRGRERGECAGILRWTDWDRWRWLWDQQSKAPSFPRLPKDGKNDLRGGDWASPRNLNLRDKTLAFQKKKSRTAVASSPNF